MTASETVRPPIVIFIHNLKTGGKTLRGVIPRQYKQNSVYDMVGKFEKLSELEDLKRLDFQTISSIQGHLLFGVHQLVPQSSTYITVLREPIDRIISLYHYILAKPGKGLHKMSGEHLESFEEFLGKAELIELDNGQTRRISGSYPAFGCCTSDMLEAAKRNLREYFTVVGLTERFDESLILMRRRLGWRSVFYKKRNVTRNKPARESLGVDILRTIEKHNALDLELYEYAVGLFEQAIEEEGRDFAEEVQLFKDINARLGRRKTSAARDGFDRSQPGGNGRPPPKVVAPDILLDSHARLMVRENELRKENTRLQLREMQLERQIAALREEIGSSRDWRERVRSRGLRRLGKWYRQLRTRLRTEPSEHRI
jgi:hypothetical protein